MSRPYRPANGTEGMVFQEKWCNKCKRDYDEDGCTIYTNAFFLEIGHKDYPKEWVYDARDVPICTAFDHVDNPESGGDAYRCPDTLDMFASSGEKPSQ